MFKEKQFQVLFSRWCKVFVKHNAVFELKISHSKSLAFSALRDHQLSALYAARYNNVFYKIPDDSIGQKPFDCFMITNAPAFVVVMFHAKQDIFYMIPIDAWIGLEKVSTRKSITEEQASEIGIKCSIKLGILDKKKYQRVLFPFLGEQSEPEELYLLTENTD